MAVQSVENSGKVAGGTSFWGSGTFQSHQVRQVPFDSQSVGQTAPTNAQLGLHSAPKEL